jgi:hypothetical protein
MAEAAVEQRPDDVAPSAPPAAPASEPAPARSNDGDDLERHLQEFESATARPATPAPDQPAAQPGQPSQPGTGGDELDQLLAELSQPSVASPLFTHGADAHQELQAQEQLQGRLDVLQSENGQLRQFVEHQRAVADFNKLCAGVQAKLPDHLPGDYAETQLLAAAINNPTLQQAFDYRNCDRRAVDRELRQVETALAHFQRHPGAAAPGQVEQLVQHSYRLGLALNSQQILKRAALEVLKRGRDHKPIDEQATADHAAVAAAVRGSSAKAQPEPPPNLSGLSDKEFARYTRQHFGF